MAESPFLRSNSIHVSDIYADAVVHLLTDRGVDQLSVRAIARWMGVSPAAVLQQHSRGHVVEIVVARFGQRWLEWSQPHHSSDLPARLPLTEDELHAVRVWQALGELARGAAVAGDPDPLSQVRAVRSDERDLVARTLARLHGRPVDPGPVDPLELDAVLALVSGLRAELAAPGATLTGEVAENILRGYLAR